ncbi:PH [Musa troglodytarum]|uniref:PH n=1 Tax=Musa troglodytarum TaxID=320322 RepID=A0A9E7KUG1_9LILI|nr:PH [Musa troglodytarum]
MEDGAATKEAPVAGAGETWSDAEGYASEKSGREVEYFGWVYHLGVNSIGHEYCHLRYLVLKGTCVAMYKREPSNHRGIIACGSAGEARKWIEAFEQAKQQAEYNLLRGSSRHKLSIDNELNLEGHRPRVRRYAKDLRKKLIKIGKGLKSAKYRIPWYTARKIGKPLKVLAYMIIELIESKWQCNVTVMQQAQIGLEWPRNAYSAVFRAWE